MKTKQYLKTVAKFYKQKSIQFVISVSFTTVAVIGMIFLGVALYLRFTNATEDMISEDNKRLLDQVNINLDAHLRNMMNVSDAMYYIVIKNSDLSKDTLNDEMSLLYETNRNMVVSISIFTDNGDLVAATPVSNLKKIANVTKEDWFIKANDRIENLHFGVPHVQNLFEDPDYRYKWVVSLSRAVELTTGGEIKHGVLLVDINFSGIEQIFKSVDLGKTGYIYLIDSEGEIIYHPRQQLIYSNLIKENNYIAANYEDGNHIEEFESTKRLITVKTAGYTGWKIVGVTPMEDIILNYYQVNAFLVFVLIFTIFLLIFVNIFISSKIANPIKSLESSVKEIENGILDKEIFVGGSYEIQHLGKTIRSMVIQMRKLMDDIVVEQELKRKSELDVLQSQINPHFLYNTLDSIVWMIENERTEEAVLMVTSLARLFRISLSKGKSIITVKDELQHAKYYMTIQKMRYKNRFTIEIKAEDEVLNLATIKLIVQPLLENSIYHGMEYMDGDGEIKVKAYIENNDLYISVSDNGLGMPEDVVNSLLTNQNHIKGKGSGIGLKNIQERIQLRFGKAYGLIIESEPDEGTTIKIHLPKIDFMGIDEKGEAYDKK